MKSKIEKLAHSQNLLRIEVEKEKIASELEEIYRQIQKTANVAGFRPGKAPAELIRQRYKKEANEEVLKRLVSESYMEAVKSCEISPIGLPEISDINFSEGSPLTFIAKVDVRPDVKIKNYKGLKLTKKDTAVSPADIEEQLRQFQERFAEFMPVENRAIIKGDYILSDLECIVDDKSIEKRENVWLLVEEDPANPDYFKQMVGKNRKETVSANTKLPDNFSNKEFANRNAVYKIFIKDIKQKRLPEINDDFAKNCGNFKTLDELKNYIKQNLKNQNEYMASADMERQIDKLLLQNSNLEAPRNLVESRFNELSKEVKEELQRRNIPTGEIDKQVKELEAKLRQQAENQAKLIFILEKIAEAENIQVSEKEVRDSIEMIAKARNMDIQKLSSNQNAQDELSLNLRDAKVMEFIIKEGNIKEDKK